MRNYKTNAFEDKHYYTKQVLKLVAIIAVIAFGVFAFFKFGAPLIDDLVMGRNPLDRYAPKAETEFDLSAGESTQQTNVVAETAQEIVCDYNIKSDPYMQDGKIVFTTDTDKSNGLFLNTMVLFDTATGESEELNIQKKYDNLLSPKITGHYIVFIDSMVDGGGRICGYDMDANEMFVIKEYGYAMPTLSVSGNYLAFSQQTGDGNQRLYLYNIETRQNVTLRLYDSSTVCGNVDVSDTDIVWAEYTTEGRGVLKRMDFSSGTAKVANSDFGQKVFEPKTNGSDILFCTSNGVQRGDLMLSVNGGEPFKIAENVLEYDIGKKHIVYSKDDAVYALSLDNLLEPEQITTDSMRGFFASQNDDEVCFYDTTDGTGLIEIVRYITLN